MPRRNGYSMIEPDDEFAVDVFLDNTMIDPNQHFANYQCPKCRNRTFATEEVSLNELPKRLLTRRKPMRFLLVTCGLCGYTEMFSLNVLENLKEPLPDVDTVKVTKDLS